jgi:hypothetical protein
MATELPNTTSPDRAPPTGKPAALPHEPIVRPAAMPVRTPTAAVAEVAPSASPSSAEASSLDAELTLIRKARSLLLEGHADEALGALDEHASRFPRGILAEERGAQRIVALCALGRTEAAVEEGRRFVAEHPRSSYGPNVQSSCAFAAAHKN